jgi:hypothetical protein
MESDYMTLARSPYERSYFGSMKEIKFVEIKGSPSLTLEEIYNVSKSPTLDKYPDMVIPDKCDTGSDIF